MFDSMLLFLGDNFLVYPLLKLDAEARTMINRRFGRIMYLSIITLILVACHYFYFTITSHDNYFEKMSVRRAFEDNELKKAYRVALKI